MSLQLAEQFEANEEYEKAYEQYLKELENDPNNIGIIERLGHLSLILNKVDEALNYYNEILKRDVTNALAYEQLISIYESRDKYKYYIYRGNKNSIEGKLEFAINDFKKAIPHAKNGTESAMARLTLANLYRQTNKMMKAIDEYNMLIEGEELHEEMFLQLADLYLKDEAYPSAIDTLMRAKQKGFDTPKVNEGLAAIYLKSGEAKKALEFTSDELLKIQCMLEIGQIEEAYEKLSNLPDELKKSPRFFTLQAQYHYSKKEFDKALESINEYNKLMPGSPLTYQMRALVYDENEDEFNAHLNWGKYNILRGNTDIAIHEFLNAIQVKDDDIDLLFELAQLLTQTGEVDHASEYYEKIIKLDPQNKEALKKLALYRENLGDTRMQAQYLEKALASDSKDLDTLKQLGKVYEKTHSKDKAIEVYTEYLELVKDPTEYKKAKAAIERLESMEGGYAGESEGLIDKIMKLFNK